MGDAERITGRTFGHIFIVYVCVKFSTISKVILRHTLVTSCLHRPLLSLQKLFTVLFIEHENIIAG